MQSKDMTITQNIDKTLNKGQTVVKRTTKRTNLVRSQNRTPENATQKVASNPVANQEASAVITSKEKKSSGKLKITFLGGVGEIGKNMTAFEYNNELT